MYEYNLGIWFETTVEQHAQRTAIWFNSDESTSYRALNKLANRIARLLIAQGVNRRDVVCISGEKSLFSFAALLGCLKVGAVYCMLDPDSPAERLNKILSVCRPGLLLGDGEFLGRLSEVTAALGIEVAEKTSDQIAKIGDNDDETNLPQTRNVTGDDPAYIMFTSGSTGFPKGAVITHAGVLNLIEWSARTFSITPDDVLTNVNPLYFDNSVFDFYAALFTGACLVPFAAGEVTDPKRLVDKVDCAGCTLWFSVPSLLIFLQTMRAADGKTLRSIRRFVFGGEGYPKSKLKLLYDAYSGSSKFFNVYGPTECTCICSCYRITDEDFADLQTLPPLGHIADNFEFLILDETCKTVPAGETGELCLLGPNVGLGYYNEPQQTAVSFVQNPYNDKFQEIMYRTGDLVRLEPSDGKLYIHGRSDNQIKHMGYRVELEEIELALHRLEYVSEAAALHTHVNGLSRIVAVVASNKEFAEDQIRLDLKRMIPDYMVPSVFYREVVLPKNPSGKVDRRNLTEKYLQSE
jgi:D-alanine--poly(phosphoribitol) ligase subunit 1